MAPTILVSRGDAQHDAAVRAGAELLRRGGLVAFPTETVYGLGADATDPVAVARIFRVKRRPAEDPLIVHVAVGAPIDEVADLSESATRRLTERLIEAFWPGPLTLVVPRGLWIAPAVTSGGPDVALRCPDHPVAQALLAQTARPVAAPSANRFGYVSPTTAAHVADDLGEECDLIIDGGPCPIGIESTIVRPLASGDIEVLRPGAVTISQLETIAQGRVVLAGRGTDRPAPGGFDRHYSPHTPTIATTSEVIATMVDEPLDLDELATRAVVLSLSTQVRLPSSWAWRTLGRRDDLAGVARHLYDRLRGADLAGSGLIVVELTGLSGLGAAIDDRLRKAAAGTVVSDLIELTRYPYAPTPNVRTAE